MSRETFAGPPGQRTENRDAWDPGLHSTTYFINYNTLQKKQSRDLSTNIYYIQRNITGSKFCNLVFVCAWLKSICSPCLALGSFSSIHPSSMLLISSPVLTFRFINKQVARYLSETAQHWRCYSNRHLFFPFSPGDFSALVLASALCVLLPGKVAGLFTEDGEKARVCIYIS